jgi:chromatin modification-related protein VID21
VVVLISRCRSSVSNRKRKLRELYKHTAYCTASLNAGYQPKVDDFQYSEPDEKERRFLDENDLSK